MTEAESLSQEGGLIMEKTIYTYGKGLDAITLCKLSNGKCQLTPSYNQQTKGIKRQLFNTEEEAIAKIREGLNYDSGIICNRNRFPVASP